MDRNYINIATTGLSLKVLDELKTLIRKLISNEYSINWVNISNSHIDLLLINENFFLIQIIFKTSFKRKDVLI